MIMTATKPAAPAAHSVKRMQMFIDGTWTGAADKRELAVEAPGTRAIIGSVPRGGAEDIDRAVKAAAKAFPSWSKLAPRDRGRMLQRIADALEAQVEALALMLAEETGNAIRTQARGEARSAVDVMRYFGGLASELKGETVPWVKMFSHIRGGSRSASSAPSSPGMRRWHLLRSRLRQRSVPEIPSC